jgi:hypothetical protein
MSCEGEYPSADRQKKAATWWSQVADKVQPDFMMERATDCSSVALILYS